MKWWQWVTLVGVLLVAGALRLVGLDWDGYQHHHPDERYITWVAATIDFLPAESAGWRNALDPLTSTFNPFRWPPAASSEGIVVLQDEPRDFAYGHVPLYLGVLATRAAERLGPLAARLLPDDWALTRDVFNASGRIEFHHLAAVGRALTALVDVGTVLLTFLLGRRLYGVNAGLLGAMFVALAVQHIQLAHFFVSDPYLTFFVVATLLFLVLAHAAGSGSNGRRVALWLALAGAAAGLAVGSKFTAVMLALPLLWTVWAAVRAGRRLVLATLAVGVMALTFAVTNPFALLDRSCAVPVGGVALGPIQIPEVNLGFCYLENVLTQNAMVSGRTDLGFTRQYAGTQPYLYFLEMQLRWGLGPLLGLVAIAGFAWALWGALAPLRGAGQVRVALDRLKARPEVILLLWAVPYFVVTGAFYVKFMRYMLPVLPIWLLFGAAMLLRWRWAAGRRVAIAAVLVTSALYAAAFAGMYRAEHPWTQASSWIYANIPSGTTLLSEQWDDSLPATMRIDDEVRRREEYPNEELTWLSAPGAADDAAKLDENLAKLAAADYVTVLSNRVYGVVPRLPERYPLSSRYHQLLFSGALGYEPVWIGGRFPTLFGLSLRPDTFGWPGLAPPTAVADYLADHPGLSFGRADESFVVYDQPLTMIFRNTGRLSVDELRAAFESTDSGE